MFMTQNHSEELLGQPFAREQFWRRVELSGDDLWYYVSTVYARVGKKGRRYYLLENPSDLVGLVGQTGERFWIERVMIVTPPWMNGTECWQMSQLKELIAAADSSDLISVDYIYQITNDLCYATRDISVINALSWHQTLYSEEKHAFPDESER